MDQKPIFIETSKKNPKTKFHPYLGFPIGISNSTIRTDNNIMKKSGLLYNPKKK